MLALRQPCTGLVEDLNKQIQPSMYLTRMPEAYGHFDADKDKLAAIQGELRKKIVEPTSDFHKIAKLLESKLEGSSSGCRPATLPDWAAAACRH